MMFCTSLLRYNVFSTDVTPHFASALKSFERQMGELIKHGSRVEKRDGSEKSWLAKEREKKEVPTVGIYFSQ